MAISKLNTISINELGDFLKKKLKKDLLDIARELKIKKIYSMKKDELVDKIIEVEKTKQLVYRSNNDIKSVVSGGSQNNSTASLELSDISKVDGHKFETVELKAFEEPMHFGEQFSIPDKYNETKIVAMVRDPKCIFTYWDINSNYYKEVGLDNKKLFLRVYDVTGLELNSFNEDLYLSIELVKNAEKWYIEVPRSNRDYCVEIGYLNENGDFISIARSNTVSVPRASFSDSYDGHWMTVEELVKISINDRQRMAINSSFEIENMISERLRMALSSDYLVASNSISSLEVARL